MFDIAVLLSDKVLSDLIGLELETCGYSVGRAEAVILITDASEPDFSVTHTYAVGISRDPESCDVKNFQKILARPVSLSELRHAVKELLDNDVKKSKNGTEKTGLVLIPASKQAVCFGRRTDLSDNEFRVLSYLYDNRDRPVGRDELNLMLGGKGNLADVYICHLRTKLSLDGRDPIETRRGEGYILRL